jgi:hypothetical protein
MPKHQSSKQAFHGSFADEYRAEMVSLGAWLIMIHAIVFCEWLKSITNVQDPNPSWARAGQFGDLVGGYVGTIFALVSVVLLYITLRAQRTASQVQAFESRYFELLKMHRENVAEVEIQGSEGRKVFVLMMREFRAVLDVVRSEAAALALSATNQQLCEISYFCLFYGVGPNSSRILRSTLSAYPVNLLDALDMRFADAKLREETKGFRKLGYEPFEGHQSRLGHYYRHLFQCVDYVNRSPEHLQRYGYVKTIRAQLSTHEQALLLLNSLTAVGRPWWQSGFIQTYRMVQNLPKDFFDPATELDLSSLFSFDPLYFEWQEANAS